METIKVEILGWDTYNEKRKDVKSPSWLRMNNTMPMSQSLFGMSAAERFVFVALLCLASQKQSSELELIPAWLCNWAGACFDIKVLESALQKLHATKTINVEWGNYGHEGLCLDDCAISTVHVTHTSRTRNVHVTCAEGAKKVSRRARAATDGRTDETDTTDVTIGTAPAHVTSAQPEEGISITTVTWNAYSTAYQLKYGVAPPKNGKGMGLCKQLTMRLGRDAAPKVAAFYVYHPHKKFADPKHPLNLLILNAEAIHTEWVTGKTSTSADSRQQELRDHNAQAIRDYVAENPEVVP